MSAVTGGRHLLQHCFTCLGLTNFECYSFIQFQDLSKQLECLLFLIIEVLNKNCSAISKNKQEALAEAEKEGSRQHMAQQQKIPQSIRSRSGSSGLAEPVLKACTHLQACGSEPNKKK